MSWRIMAALIAVVLLALVVQDVPLAGYLRDVERERIVTALERDAFVLAGRSEESLHAVTAASAAEITDLARKYRDAGGARVVIVGADGTAIVTSDDDAAGVGDSFSSRPEIATALDGGIASGTRFSQTLGEDLLYVAVPVLSGQDVVGAVRLTYPAKQIDDAVNGKLTGLALVGLTTVLLAALVGLVLSRSITRRLRLLTDATERFAAGDRSVRADETTGAPELRSLAGSFNGMAERIDGMIEQQRAFAGDASHQLRTPLTALRLRLERARELAPTDGAAAAVRIEAAEAELDRLDTLVEGLLVLSRAEGSDASPVPMDLSEVVGSRVESWQALAQEAGVAVSLEAPASAPVLAVPTAAEQIVDNLIDNALTASASGSGILVRIDRSAEGTELHVIDHGPGLTAEQRERAFDRFWRGRSDEHGTGLGLAIVAQLVRASGATIELLPAEGGGLDAVVRFSNAR